MYNIVVNIIYKAIYIFRNFPWERFLNRRWHEHERFPSWGKGMKGGGVRGQPQRSSQHLMCSWPWPQRPSYLWHMPAFRKLAERSWPMWRLRETALWDGGSLSIKSHGHMHVICVIALYLSPTHPAIQEGDSNM